MYERSVEEIFELRRSTPTPAVRVVTNIGALDLNIKDVLPIQHIDWYALMNG